MAKIMILINFLNWRVPVNNNKVVGKPNNWLRLCSIACLGLLICVSKNAVAENILTLGQMASQITNSFEQLAKLITAGSYIAGLGFSISAIMKFKQHKDNPTQIPIGTPIALVFISAVLLFLPSFLGVVSSTMFGESGGEVAGPKGTVFASVDQKFDFQ
nr:type IV secretion protein IcmD [Legionella sainthelensi]